MKSSRYRTTLCGTRATRRIQWFHPNCISTASDDERVNVFVVLSLTETGEVVTVAVSSQLGVDRRGRHVLPNNIVAPLHPLHDDRRLTTMIYHVSAPVGRLPEAAEEVRKNIERLLNDNHQLKENLSLRVDSPVSVRNINQ